MLQLHVQAKTIIAVTAAMDLAQEKYLPRDSTRRKIVQRAQGN